jgi:GNAT superfamily N-acetyltransferase
MKSIPFSFFAACADLAARSRGRVKDASRDTLIGVSFSTYLLSIRPATINDVTLLRTLIRELADFEHQLDLVSIKESDLERDGFGTSPKFRALIAEGDGQHAGYALFFGYYSTWVGPGLYLEDLFVRQQFRGRGIGIGLLAAVAQTALQ